MRIRSVVIALPRPRRNACATSCSAWPQAGVTTKILSRLVDLADDKAAPRERIRELKFEDLLGRPPVPPRLDLFARCVRGKTVLVTGAGGSIGSELCRQIVTLGPSRLHLLDHSEFALYTIRQELGTRFPDCPSMPTSARSATPGWSNASCATARRHRLPRRRLQARAAGRSQYRRGPAQQRGRRPGHRQPGRAPRGRDLRADFQRQGGAPDQHHGRQQAHRRTDLPGRRRAHRAGTTFCMVRFGNVLGSSGSVIPCSSARSRAAARSPSPIPRCRATSC
jgi:hypothetical protein